jgi:hypothetical protein
MTETHEGPSAESRHPAVAGVLRFFEYDHLPEGMIKLTARAFADFAAKMVAILPSDPELTVALRKLLEAKDAAVRCAVVDEKARRGVATIVNPSEFAATTSGGAHNRTTTVASGLTP